MPLQLSQVELSEAYRGSVANRNVEKSLNKIATGKKLHADGKDSAAYAQSLRIESQQKHGLKNLQNLQNLISYSQAQEGALNKAAEILDRMGVLATQSLDLIKNEQDRVNHDKEFQELAKSLDEIEGMKFNDLDLFSDGPFSEGKKSFITLLQSQWLSNAEQVIKDRLGLQGNGTDTFRVVVNDEGNNAYSIQLTWNYTNPTTPDKETDLLQMSFESYNYSSPPSEDSDHMNATMMTYAVMSNNFYFNAMANGQVNKGDSASGGAIWFKSGIADFVHGGDSLVRPQVTQSQINGIANGDLYSTRSSSYLAVRYLHEELKNSGAGANNGVKDMLIWMANQVKAGKSPEESSIGAALKNFIPSKYSNANTANDEFIADFKTNGLSVLSNVVKPLNDDTGAITGLDADGGSEINQQDAVPDYPATDPTTSPLSNFGIKWEKEGKTLFSSSSDGSSLTFNAVNTVTVVDTDRYNLKSVSSSKLTLSMIETISETLNEERSQLGANIQRLQTETDNQESQYSVKEFALSRIADVDLAEESTNLAANKIRAEASIAMLAQAQKLNVGVADLIGDMKIGKP